MLVWWTPNLRHKCKLMSRPFVGQEKYSKTLFYKACEVTFCEVAFQQVSKEAKADYEKCVQVRNSDAPNRIF